ncbi:MAG: hypothetical protein CM15mP13_2440 [Pseudomonadota bacterium]|nr:MAG: hypothetical protein CM15mP13_2440 [Pseudomonadota bacterium]
MVTSPLLYLVFIDALSASSSIIRSGRLILFEISTAGDPSKKEISLCRILVFFLITNIKGFVSLSSIIIGFLLAAAISKS